MPGLIGHDQVKQSKERYEISRLGPIWYRLETVHPLTLLFGRQSGQIFWPSISPPSDSDIDELSSKTLWIIAQGGEMKIILNIYQK